MTDFRIESKYYLKESKEPGWQRALLPPNELDHESSSGTALCLQVIISMNYEKKVKKTIK